tara:strand:- start:300 stop:491 length:192 start_codon:yes stop_codon:yes gene_type:complete
MTGPDRADTLHEYWVEVVEDLFNMPVVVPVLFRLCDEHPSGRVTLAELLDLKRLKAIVDGGGK